MANRTRRPLSGQALERRRAQRREARTSATYKNFLKDLMSRASLTEEQAAQAAASVLCALEQRLLHDEAQHLEAQLPQKLQLLLHRCERHEELLPRKVGREEILQMIAGDLEVPLTEAERLARAVLQVVSQHVTLGEIEDVVLQLPSELRALWPREVLTAVLQKQARASTAPKKPAPAPHAARPSEPLSGIVGDLLQLPFDAQLGVLRTIAPKIISRLSREAREGFLRDMNREIAGAEAPPPAP
ncbi:MAG: DUF2267 domain-containing protein [Myxococcota bacterium]